MQEQVKEIAEHIGQYYLHKNNNNYVSTEKELLDLRITKVDIVEGVVMLTTARPGRLIGKRGRNIDELSKYLNRTIKIFEDTDNLYDYLIPDEREYADDRMSASWIEECTREWELECEQE